MADLNLPQDKDLANKMLDNDREKYKNSIEIGWLGKIWGSPKTSPNNIAGLAIILLLLFGIGWTTIKSENSQSIKDLWSIITPIITLAFGYLFGEKSKKG